MNDRRQLLEQLPSLSPEHFFELAVTIPFKKELLLPDTSDLLGEDSFAKVSFYSDEEKIKITALIDKPFEECFFPQYQGGDCLELFIDTRDLKTAGFLTKFCHHFLILPAAVQEIASHEMTHFRGDDSHPLCDPEEIGVKPIFRSSKYELHVELPASCLHGYDPEAFNRMGFTYKINRFKGNPQHFSVSSQACNIAQTPALWSRFNLRR